MEQEKISIKFRRVYKYICTGCEKKRIAYRYDRAKKEKCTKCTPTGQKIADGQASLFDHIAGS